MLDFDKVPIETLAEWRDQEVSQALVAKIMRLRTTEIQNAVDSVKTTVPNAPYQSHIGGKLAAIDELLHDIMRK